LNGQEFVGVWEVFTGDMHRAKEEKSEVEHYAIILFESGKFRLYCREGRDGPIKFRQDLLYDPYSRTLNNIPEKGPDRCISFWDLRSRGCQRNRIFAARKGGPAKGSDEKYLPWELLDGKEKDISDDGSWGAEEGGG
jgi:hypothetical protein